MEAKAQSTHESNHSQYHTVNQERLKKDIFDLSRIGLKEDDKGLYRIAYSEADMEGRDWLMGRIRDAGMIATIDGAGNVFGRMPDTGDQPSVIVGSHLDTVPCGGALDGALGVLTALECMRTMHEQGFKTRYPLELVAFSDEEGRFGGMFGSQAFIGDVTPERIYNSVDSDGISMMSEMEARGMDPLKALDAWRNPDLVHAFLELHIEQGPVLETLGHDIGIVEGIAGLFKWQVRLRGAANHEGTTPMHMRNDAFLALADFAHEIPRVLDENGTEHSRATIGKVELSPGFPHTIPGQAEFTLVARDATSEMLDELEIAFRKALSAIARKASLMFEFDIISRIEPTTCDEGLVKTLEKAAGDLHLKSHRMYSGAGHDAQFMAQITRSGMLFVPSKGGVSHSPGEWTDWHHIENGANLMLNALLEIAEAETRVA
jgi:N-carbamoyl-L-amino-acid hydrolase